MRQKCESGFNWTTWRSNRYKSRKTKNENYFLKTKIFIFFIYKCHIFTDFKTQKIIFSMTSQVQSQVDVLSAENKNPVMLLNERRRALKWEER